MTLPLKTAMLATAASAFLIAAPVTTASAAPLGVAPSRLVKADMPIENVRYRRHVKRHRHHATRHRALRHRHYSHRRAYVARYYGRPYRYRYNPGAAILGTVLGTIAGAAAYNYYDPGYYYPYAYPAYGYGYTAYPAYPTYYGWGGGGWGWGGGWGRGRVIRAGHWGWRRW